MGPSGKRLGSHVVETNARAPIEVLRGIPDLGFFTGGVHPSAVFPDTQPTFFGLKSQEEEGLAAQVARVGLQ